MADAVLGWKDLDFDRVNFDMATGTFSWGRGGYPLSDNEWFISELLEDGSEIRYKLPYCIAYMFQIRFEEGDRIRLSKIKHALKL